MPGNSSGGPSLKVARSARSVQGFPLSPDFPTNLNLVNKKKEISLSLRRTGQRREGFLRY